MFSNGHASTIGLPKTSINPLPIAYKITLIIIPANGDGIISGNNAKPTRPAAEQNSEATMHTLYPILSTHLAQNKSTKSCVKKKNVDIRAIFPSEIL